MIERFVARRKTRWERLSSLLDRAGSARGLSVQELDELARLYRQATSDLAVASRDFPDDRATLFVNQLVTRGHGVIYRSRPAPLSAVRRFFTRDLPREYRSSWAYLVAAAALFFGPLLAVAVAEVADASVAALVVPPTLLAEIQEGNTWFDVDTPGRSYMASVIMTNNIQVSLMALGGGMLAGVGTVAVLAYNGISIGGVTGALVAYGLGDALVGFVSPHGFLELSIVVIAGACGLMLGRAIVWAGLQTRRQALGTAARRAVRLLLGVLPFLVVAGLIEGFVSPAQFPWPWKLAVGLLTAAVMYGYLLGVGRDGRAYRRARSFSSR